MPSKLVRDLRAKMDAQEKPMETQASGITMEEVLKLIATMNEQNQKNMLTAIAEMKKPTLAEQAKIDKEELKVKQQQVTRLKMADAEETRKKNQMAGCQHATVHPGTGMRKHAWRAQVHTPNGEKPYFVPTCTQCLSQLPKILATPEMLTQGVNLDQYMGLDVDTLKKWSMAMEAA